LEKGRAEEARYKWREEEPRYRRREEEARYRWREEETRYRRREEEARYRRRGEEARYRRKEERKRPGIKGERLSTIQVQATPGVFYFTYVYRDCPVDIELTEPVMIQEKGQIYRERKLRMVESKKV
jgi:hypothetical protein